MSQDQGRQRPPITLDEYQALVDRCAALKLNQPIANGCAEHARILISKLFEVAKRDVVLVSGQLTQRTEDGAAVYLHTPVLDNAKHFLRRPSTSLSIIVQGGAIDGGEQNGFLKALVEDSERRGALKVYVPRSDVLGEAAPHFMVCDSEAYRLETGEDAKPINKSVSAIANFGDAKAARSLAALFDDLIAYLKSGDRLASPPFYLAALA